MKAKFTVMLAALLMLFCMSANAQKALKGDVNGDGVVDNADIEEVTKIITGDSDNPNGDVNGDGRVNVADIVNIVDISENPPVANPVITFSVKIANNTDVSVTLDGDVVFILGNPDHNGSYLGWEGSFNYTDHIRFSNTTVTLAAGETKTFNGLTWKDDESGFGMGEKSPLDLNLFETAGCSRNVLLSADGKNDVVMCDNMDPGIIFRDGGTYDIIISSAPSPVDPSPVDPEPVNPGNPVININVNITNNTGSPLALDGRLRFVLGNPDHNGTYYGGYMGDYLRTDNIYFSPTSIVLGAGETRSFTDLSWRDADTGCGLGETSPLNPGRLPILDDQGGIAYARNVLMYIGGRSDLVLCDNLSSSIVFKDGETYDIVVSGGSAPAPQPVSGGTNPVISFGVRITNAHGSPLSLDGRLRFVLGNPDHNGTYYGGYMGDYLRTDNIWFSSTPIVLGAGETREFYGLSWRDADTGYGLGETSPLNPGRLPIYSDDGGIAYARNVLIYIGGRSDLILCDNLSGSLIFQQDGMYDIVIR